MEPSFPSYFKICTLDLGQNNRNFMIWRFIKLVSEALHFSYDLVVSVDGYLGHRLPDGNVSGIFGMLERGECDISMDMFAVTEARREAADFSFPYHFTDITFMTQKPRIMAKSFAIFYPFSAGVWIALVILLLAMSLAFFAVLRRRRRGRFQDVLVVLFGNLLHEQITYRFKRSGHKLLVASWIIGVFFVTASYQATLLSFLTVPTYVGIRSTAELSEAVGRGTVKCITRKGSFLVNYFRDSTDESVRAVGDCLLENSARSMDVEEFLDNYTTSGVYITARTLVRPLEVKYYLPIESYFPVIAAIAIPKTFCCRKRLDRVVKRINEAYLYEKIVDDVTYVSSLKKQAEVKDAEYEVRISLNDLSGSFAILAVGYTLGFVALGYEILLFRYRRKLGA